MLQQKCIIKKQSNPNGRLGAMLPPLDDNIKMFYDKFVIRHVMTFKTIPKYMFGWSR